MYIKRYFVTFLVPTFFVGVLFLALFYRGYASFDDEEIIFPTDPGITIGFSGNVDDDFGIVSPYPEEVIPDSTLVDIFEDSDQTADIKAIRSALEALIYDILPLLVGCLILYKFCMWFYYTFIKSVF